VFFQRYICVGLMHWIQTAEHAAARRSALPITAAQGTHRRAVPHNGLPPISELLLLLPPLPLVFQAPNFAGKSAALHHGTMLGSSAKHHLDCQCACRQPW
jgi:hypothetical protein